MSPSIQLIKKILLAFEQSTTSIKYNAIYTYDDGPNDTKQITLSFGITEYGNLKKFLETYLSKNGQYSKDFLPYISQIGKKSLANNVHFINLLKESAKDPVMQQCQEEAYDSMYLIPALSWCEKLNFRLPLSELVIADSFLQSGSILNSLRNSFSTKPPNCVDGNEKEWILNYCKARKVWLQNHSRSILHKTVYRMNFMLSLIEENDWLLSKSLYTANGVKIVANS